MLETHSFLLDIAAYRNTTMGQRLQSKLFEAFADRSRPPLIERPLRSAHSLQRLGLGAPDVRPRESSHGHRSTDLDAFAVARKEDGIDQDDGAEEIR
jgi:hypothetical protein